MLYVKIEGVAMVLHYASQKARRIFYYFLLFRSRTAIHIIKFSDKNIIFSIFFFVFRYKVGKTFSILLCFKRI